MDIFQKIDKIIFALIIFLAFLIGKNGIYARNLNKIELTRAGIEKERKINEILGFIGVIERKIVSYQKRSFPSPEVTHLLDRISELAKQLNIEIEAFTPLPAVSTEQYVELPLETPLKCQYHQLGQLLGFFESNREFIWVKELKMKKPTATTAEKAKVPEIELTVSGAYIKSLK